MDQGTVVIILIIGIYLLSSIKIITEYERAVIFRLGRVLPRAGWVRSGARAAHPQS